jgi:hypothetical protein
LGIASVEDFDSDDDGELPDLNVFDQFVVDSDDGFESVLIKTTISCKYLTLKILYLLL